MVRSDFTMQEYSNQDFLRLIEHRIRKEMRQNSFISLKKSYQLQEQSSLQSQVLLYFLKKIFHERLDISSGDLIETDYLEMFISKKLEVFLHRGNSDILLDKLITPLRSITEHEIQEVAKILSLKGTFVPVDQKTQSSIVDGVPEQNVFSIISGLQEKYPQTKPSFLKSFANIERLEKK